jgi:hypothetical protein
MKTRILMLVTLLHLPSSYAQYAGWPANTPVDEKTEVRVHGEYGKSLIGDPEVEVTSMEKLQ